MATSIIIILNGEMKNTGNMMFGMHGHVTWNFVTWNPFLWQIVLLSYLMEKWKIQGTWCLACMAMSHGLSVIMVFYCLCPEHFFMLLFLLDQQALISCLVLIYTYVKDLYDCLTALYKNQLSHQSWPVVFYCSLIAENWYSKKGSHSVK